MAGEMVEEMVYIAGTAGSAECTPEDQRPGLAGENRTSVNGGRKPLC
jgi:hypothetical protein